ncbi:MAG: hypothetical protein A2X64_08565 [Ignavibacteria bacterium GWF2_33_9]|nr:MAG: hypothetical protein A2X64_08565 [Ignavibacteria bacterium GWF2_33_9]
MKTFYLFYLIFFLALTSFAQEINWTFELKDSSFGQTAAGDIDGDGKLELVFGCYRNDGNIYALNAEDGSLLWKYNTSLNGKDACNDAAPIIYDIDEDGIPEVIVASSCTARTYCLNGTDGTVKWAAQSRGSDSPPSIADIDNDGKDEILHGEFGGYVICFDALTGAQEWEIAVDTHSWIQTAPSIADFDLDGNLDFVVATWNAVEGDTNRVYAYRGYDQKLLWSFDLAKYAYHGTAIANLDEDFYPELVIGDYSGLLIVLNAEDGSLVWDAVDSPSYYIGGPVAIGNIDTELEEELVIPTGSQIVCRNKNGDLKWKIVQNDAGQSFRGVALSDITGDNIPDILLATSTGKVAAYSGIGTPSQIFEYNINDYYGKSLDFNNAPIVADFDEDGTLDMFVIGGYTTYPDYESNYGLAISFKAGKGAGPDWLMFQKNIRRTSSDYLDPVSVKDVPMLGKVIISPNPSSEYIIIDYPFNKNEQVDMYETIRIFDVLGNEMQTTCIHKQSTSQERNRIQINVSALPTGTYFLRTGSVVQKFMIVR